jgi:hypothetical protein
VAAGAAQERQESKKEDALMGQQMKLLIGYDGSSCAEGALLDLRRAGLPQTVEAVVMCVADVLLPPQEASDAGLAPTPPMPMPEPAKRALARALQAIEEAKAIAQRASERLRTHFPAWKVHAEACADPPAWCGERRTLAYRVA